MTKIGRPKISRVILRCEICDKEFERRESEVKRNKVLGRRIYCSLKCCGKGNVNNIPIEKRYHPENLKSGNRLDEFSPFKLHLKTARMHSKEKSRECTITLQDLKEQWEKQKGICPFTGWSMINLPKTNAQFNDNEKYKRASLDRIDSSKGYVPGNIRFVCLIANYAKSTFTDQDLIGFCEAVISKRYE